MSSKIYEVNGRKYSRFVKQGRPQNPLLLKREETIILHVTKNDKDNFIQAQKMSGFSQSFFGNLALSLGIKQLSDSNNCSKT